MMNENNNRRREVADSPFDVDRMDQLDVELLNATEHMFDTGSDTENFLDDDIELRLLARLDALRDWVGLAFNVMIYIVCVLTGGLMMVLNITDILEESRGMEEDAYLHVLDRARGVGSEVVQWFLWLVAIDFGRFHCNKILGLNIYSRLPIGTLRIRDRPLANIIVFNFLVTAMWLVMYVLYQYFIGIPPIKNKISDDVGFVIYSV